MELISNYPWYYSLLCILAGFIFSGIMYYRDKHYSTLSQKIVLSLFSLRFLSVSIICFLLLDIFIKRIINETEKPIIIVAQDNSSSIISSNDSNFIKTNYLTALKNLTEEVGEKYEIKTYQFDSETSLSTNFDFGGKETNLSGLFNELENNYVNTNVGAIILASDGIYNKGSNPLYHLSTINAPIHCIALGDTTPIKDVWIQNINHNQIAYLKNSFPVEVLINAVDVNNKTVSISISKGGKLLKSENITINSSNFSDKIQFYLDAEQIGLQNYTVAISVLNEEINSANNTQSFVIDVIDNRDKILLLASAPHPDIAAIKQSIINSQTYELDIAYVSQFNKSIKPYSLIILHQVPQLPTLLLNELNLGTQSFWIIGNTIPNGLGLQSQLNNSNRFNEVEAAVQSNFVLFNISEKLTNYLKEFPAVKCNFGNSVIPNGSSALMHQKIGSVETTNALFYFNEINAKKSAVFNGDGLWKWRLRDYAEHSNHELFNELITKTVQYLSVKADKSFFRVFTKKIINENEELDFSAEVYNQSYELVTEPDVTLVLKDEKNKSYNYTFSKKQNNYKLNPGKFAAGEYRYEAVVKYGDKTFTKNGLITIKEIISEKINTVANHQLLYQISKKSGGNLYYKNQLEQLKNELLNSDDIKTITYTSKQLDEFINLKWLFFVILILLSTEWFLRKYNGKL